MEDILEKASATEEQRKKLLDQAGMLETLVATPGWQEVLLPWLNNRTFHAWEDPQYVTDKDDFFYRYVVQWAKAESTHQILKFVNDTIAHANKIAEAREEKKDES